jgi:hypothetical protein
MLEKSSVAVSLIGIASMYEYVEGQTPPTAKQKQPQQQDQKVKDIVGTVMGVSTSMLLLMAKLVLQRYSFLAPDQIV